MLSVETESEVDKSKSTAPVLSFAPSKWESVDESELEAQGDLISSSSHSVTSCS